MNGDMQAVNTIDGAEENDHERSFCGAAGRSEERI